MAGIQEKKATISAVHSPGLDESKIGNEDALSRDVFDAAHQVAQRGMKFFNNRCRIADICVRNENVHLVAIK